MVFFSPPSRPAVTLLVHAGVFPPRFTCLACAAALALEAVRNHFEHQTPTEELSHLTHELDSSGFWADSPAPPGTDDSGKTCELRLSDDLDAADFSQTIPDNTKTLIVRAEDVPVHGFVVDSIERILAHSAQRESPWPVFILLRVNSVDEALIQRVLDYPNLTLVHCEPHCEAMPHTAEEASASASAVAAIAQIGVPVPVRLSAQAESPSSFTERCRQWTVINRGSGLIISPHAGAIEPEQYAKMLIELYEGSFLPSDRIVPLNGYLSSLGGAEGTLPSELVGLPVEVPSGNGEAPECLWRGFRGHRCQASPDGRRGWSCRVADVIYPHLLRAIATETLSNTEDAVAPPGHRLRALLHNGAIEFRSEPLSNQMQFAPDPTSGPPQEFSAAKGESA